MKSGKNGKNYQRSKDQFVETNKLDYRTRIQLGRSPSWIKRNPSSPRPRKDKCQVAEDKCQVSEDKYRARREMEYFREAIKSTGGRKGKSCDSTRFSSLRLLELGISPTTLVAEGSYLAISETSGKFRVSYLS
ncbi:hypothetical protein F2Q69_00047533 [Brassica cretica]|uniref:Uncharacterized protein n=1 Tax=Brassica cretica TaxID=69181 RepID=A0A8S9PWE1_BRACR|nr:hypothetical protein F2Q69_00047533 [Brassica cretica]